MSLLRLFPNVTTTYNVTSIYITTVTDLDKRQSWRITIYSKHSSKITEN